MYHMIFRAKLRKSFEDINAGRYDLIVPQFSPEHEHDFFGDHALAGFRRDMEATRKWYARLARLFPDLKFEIKNIVSNGPPWNTVAAVEWVDRFTVDGRPYSNQGVHIFRFSWGKVKALRIYCDTQKLRDVFQRKAEAGMDEALARPIETGVI